MSKKTTKQHPSVEKVNAWAHNKTQDYAQNILQTQGHKNRVQCPFHNSADPDMAYNKKTGLWKCFGSCDTVFGDSTSVATMLRENIAVEDWKKMPVQKKVDKKIKTAKKYWMSMKRVIISP